MVVTAAVSTPTKNVDVNITSNKPAALEHTNLSSLSGINDAADLTYNSEEDLDYHPEADEEDYDDDDDDFEYHGTEDEDEDDDDDDADVDGVFDKAKKGEISSSSSSVSLDHGLDHDNSKLKLDNISSKLQQQQEELHLTAHKKFSAFIHKHEIPRKLLHVSIGFITLYFYTIDLSTQLFVPYLTTACGIIFSLDLLRFRSEEFNRLYCNAVGFLMREKEVNGYNGVIWYLLGLSIAFKPFPKDIGVMAVLLLSWSDTAASTIGRAYGYLTPKIARNKSLAGSIAAFVIGVVSCLVFYGFFIPKYQHLDDVMWSSDKSYLSLTTYSIACGFIAALSEGIDILNWDDNFTIPTFSSVFLYGLVKATNRA